MSTSCLRIHRSPPAWLIFGSVVRCHGVLTVYLLQKAMELDAAQIRRYLDVYRSSSSDKGFNIASHDFSLPWDGINTMDGNRRLIALYSFGVIRLSSSLGSVQHVPDGRWIGSHQFEHRCRPGVILSTPRCCGRRMGRMGKMGGRQSLVIIQRLCCRICPRIPDARYVTRVFERCRHTPNHALRSRHLVIISHDSYHPPHDRLETHQVTPHLPHSAPLMFRSKLIHSMRRPHRALLILFIVSSVITGFTTSTSRLRYRILGFFALFAICVRLMAMSTISREE